MMIREESSADIPAIRQVHFAAFGRSAEGVLVDRLRTDGLFVASIVADDDGGIMGHALFSALAIKTSAGLLSAVALAPVGVIPRCQREGVGSALIACGIRICRERGKVAIIVLGDPHYYAKFGFRAELTSKLKGPFAGKHWMAMELIDGCLSDVVGNVEYPAAFALVD